MPSSPAACLPFVRVPFVAVALLVLVLVLGCSQAPPAGSAVATKPAAHADHGHDHAAGDAHHEHAHEDDHEHDEHAHADHAHPETLAEGVTALEKAAAAVKEHLEAGARDAADDAIHGLGHLLEDLQGLVRKDKLPAEAEAAATAAIDELFDCFDKLDTALHAEPGKGDSPKEVHASVAERIEKAIGSLRAAAQTSGGDDDAAAAIIRNAQENKED